MAEAVAARDRAIAGFFTELTALAKVATELAEEMVRQVREEEARQQEKQRARRPSSP